MDALPLFLLILSAAALGGVIGGVIGYRMARLYYSMMAARIAAAAWRTVAEITKDTRQ